MSVRVAVIDSGVNPAHPHISGVAGGVGITMAGEIETGDNAWLDRLGHGTAVMAAIQERAPQTATYAVKVFHDALQTRAIALVRAIDWCLANRMDVINLSLGTMNPIYTEAFEDAVQRCAARGTLLVSARRANDTPCYPGCLSGVFGVELDWDVPRDAYRIETIDGQHVFHASGYPRPIPGVALSRNLYGVSFAVANVCGFIARACDAPPTASRHETVAQRLAQEAA